ncbi:uncharacterized protein LOC100213644 [Hydra vulgaris]|uniref:uncharacterized protein LOC100213644 n=1 Tax=Hydra vulgaris TaxID=6087 RepID=UPI001F5F2A3E|nr:uncharacterized protein LOC100213644 [Hydra vulgaris]
MTVINTIASSGFTNELSLLCSSTKLERDRGSLTLKCSLSKIAENENGAELCSELQKLVLEFFANYSDGNWESLHGHLEVGKLLIDMKLFSPDFPRELLNYSLIYIEHTEFRVRILAGEVLGKLCENVDTSFYKDCEPILMESVKKHLRRDVVVSSESLTHKTAQDIFHDTAGWKSLETSMKALQCVVDGCGLHFFSYMNKDLLNLIFESLKHTNRFVRETAYYLCASIARFGILSQENCDKELASQLCESLRKGLSDNWSQVRLAASVATRQFFQDLNETDKKVYYKTLLPAMCINRYYLAEGVRLYNQESWRLILGNDGRANVELLIEDVVTFYISQTESDNHAVREAACHCMAELGTKISPEVVRPYLPRLLEALHFCFKDDSWPVRDTACVACGNFALSFPQECAQLIDTIYPLFFTNLGDPIPTVRQGAAVALKNVVKAFGEKSADLVFKKLNEGLGAVEFQKASSERYDGLEKGAATYGVVKKLHDNDLDLHSNQVMYSCGSLAPKMKRGGGCSDHSFKRPSEPWELADGCVYLLSELSSVSDVHKHVVESIRHLIEAIKFKHYIHHLNFFESVSKVLPNIAKGLGKRIFKQHIEGFFDMLFYSLSSENALSKLAANECVEFFIEFFGLNIVKGRVENFNPSYMAIFDQIACNKFM